MYMYTGSDMPLKPAGLNTNGWTSVETGLHERSAARDLDIFRRLIAYINQHIQCYAWEQHIHFAVSQMGR